MPKVTVKDLERIKQRFQAARRLRQGKCRARMTVHMGDCGIAAGAREIVSTLMALNADNESAEILVTVAGCAGACEMEPMMTVEMADECPVTYGKLSRDAVVKIFEEHLLGGNVVNDFVVEPEASGAAP